MIEPSADAEPVSRLPAARWAMSGSLRFRADNLSPSLTVSAQRSAVMCYSSGILRILDGTGACCRCRDPVIHTVCHKCPSAQRATSRRGKASASPVLCLGSCGLHNKSQDMRRLVLTRCTIYVLGPRCRYIFTSKLNCMRRHWVQLFAVRTRIGTVPCNLMN